MKNISRRLEELGIVLRRNLSNVVTSVRFRLTLGFVLFFACTIISVDIIISYVRSFFIMRNLDGIGILYEHGSAIQTAVEQTVNDARDIDYIIYGILLIVLTVISYRISGFMLRPVSRALDAHQRFISNANHELRTPLSIAVTALELAHKRSLQTHNPTHDEHASLLSEYHEATHTALAEVRIIDEILRNLNTISYIYAGHAPTKERLHVGEVTQKTVARLSPLAHEKNITLTCLVDPTPCHIDANEAGLVQILSNIISNAIKYTPAEGTVQVCTFPEGAYVSVVVHDSGPGIDPVSLARVHEPFFRSANVKHIEGTGLGLTVVHELIKLNHGTLRIHSSARDGTACTVRFKRGMH